MSTLADSRALARFRGVSQRFNDVVALDNVSLELPAGRLIGLIGPDGVGKSSLLDLLSGARALQTGALEVFGVDMSGSRLRQALLPRIAYMPQGLGKNLFDSLTVEENLQYFAALFGHDHASSRMRIDGLTEYTGLRPFLQRKIAQLSGGMRQKLGLCCALLHQPDLLILDEPTTGLDPLSRVQFWALIDQIRRAHAGISIVVATSIMEEAMGFDFLVAMNSGRILARASPQGLLAQTGQITLEAAFIALLGPHAARFSEAFVEALPVDAEREVVIEANNLVKRFGDFVAVDGVSFQIRRGEIFGFVGSNGCGKTTTMKMLTGLLPATSGESRLFGSAIDAANQGQRCRVGYMTQTFSLYGELTVRQNLVLHARLFRLDASQLTRRVSEVLEKFSLNDKADLLPSKLPLGIRQRLALAVAMVHRPEVLILDEPTSGVDPMARDEFWNLMMALSRQECVTFFISTHFMNEAQRCDRVALMHEGRVLDCGAPSELTQRHGFKTLQEVFISLLTNVSAANISRATSLADLNFPGRKEGMQGPLQLGMRRFFSVALREIRELYRDPARSALALFGSLMMMFVVGLGISLDVDGLRFAVLDRDQTNLSRDYVSALADSPYFIQRPLLESYVDLDQRMRSGEVSLAVEIPFGFARDILRGDIVEVGAWIDGAMPHRAATMLGYVEGMHEAWLQTLVGASDRAMPSEALQIEMRYRYNPEVKSVIAMIPAVIPMILLMLPATLAALSVVREKELGTIVNFYVTPLTRAEFLLGKQVVYIALAMLNFLVMCLAAVLMLDVPMTGSFAALSIATLFFVICSTGLGLLTASLTRSQIAAMFFSMVCTMIPAVQFSGLINPVASLEGFGRLIGQAYPASHMFTISRGVFTKAQQLPDLWSHLLFLAVAALGIVLVSILLFRKQAH